MSNQVQVGNRSTAIRTILAEAQSEGATGMLAAAAVAVNRARQTGLSVEDIFLQRGQFEPHMTVDGRERMSRYREGTNLWNMAANALDRALGGEDPTGGADHFFSPGAQAAAGRARPVWAAASKAIKIGRHEFFKLGYGNGSRSRNDTQAGERAASPPVAVEMPEPLTRADRESLATSILGGSPSDPIRAKAAGSRDKPEGITEREAWGNLMDASTATNAPGGPVDGNAGAWRVTAAEQDKAATEAKGAPLGDQIASAWDGTITAAIGRSISRHLEVDQPDYGFDYTKHMAELENGRSLREREQLRREARSLTHARELLARQDEVRKNNENLQGVGGMAVNLAVNVLDPAGWAVGAGATAAIGKTGLSVARVARSTNPGLMRSASVLGLTMADSAIGNVAATGVLDALGETVTTDDYLASALFGAAIGGGLGAFGLRYVNGIPGPTSHIGQADLTGTVNGTVGAVADQQLADVAEAAARAPANASPREVAALTQQVEAERVGAAFDNTLNPIPESNRILDPNFVLTPEQATAWEGLTVTVGDEIESTLIKTIAQRAADIGANLPIDSKAGTLEGVWLKSGAASTSLKLTRSEWDVARGLNAALFEGTTGHNGRAHSAALEVVTRETALNRELRPVDSAYEAWRRGKGYSSWDMMYNHKVQEEWNDAVWTELRRRERPDLYPANENPAVVAAADAYRNFYKAAGDEQVRWGAMGAGAIDTSRDWYIPQEVSGGKVKAAAQNGTLPIYQRAIREQAVGIFGWDKKFATFFSKHYMDLALNRANGGFTVPTRLDHPSAGEFVSDLLENMREATKDAGTLRTIQDFEKKFERGGPGYSKKRLDFDVMNTYVVDGKTYRLADIMNKDMLDLSRRYGRRASANIALTKAGLPGRYGLDLARKTMELGLSTGKITEAEMRAFNQGLSELSGIPIGNTNRVSAYADSLRMLTSAIKLGGAAYNQFAEYFNAFATIGVRNTLAQIPAIPKTIAEVKRLNAGEASNHPMLKSVDAAIGYELGLENYIMDRVFDVPLDGVSLYGHDGTNVIHKTARASSYLVAKYSGQRILTAVQTRGMADVISKQMAMYVKSGKAKVLTKQFDDMGINARLRERLTANIDRIAKFDKAGRPVEMDLRAGDLTPAEVAEIAGAIQRGSHQIIQRTYPGETGTWAHDPLLRLLTQFRTFSLTAVEKQWGRQVRTVGHARVLGSMLGALPFVFAIHTARVNISSAGMPEDERKKYLEQRMAPAAIAQAMTNYLSASGFLGDAMDIGGTTLGNVANSLGAEAPDWAEGVGNVRGDFIGGGVAPAVGVGNDLAAFAMGDVSKLRRLLPGQSIPALAIPLNIVEGGLEDLTDDEE